MISIRQLIIVALVIGIFWLLGRLRRHFAEKPSKWVRRHPAYKEAYKETYKETVRCERCGLYLPRTRSSDKMGEYQSCNDDDCPVRHIGSRG